ncbi:hypothetical protein SKAU_G00146820 [Synaphobranchus kaupii]|uniref:Uncharacterized protein n=1 Tax=Synaphobranchus kaupii TaxID=118154 RepID=A0A9Q1FU10_SYNKA|nr:hypothetical protein SKAU_G00146820 [Synaphobranchus kaupii]
MSEPSRRTPENSALSLRGRRARSQMPEGVRLAPRRISGISRKKGGSISGGGGGQPMRKGAEVAPEWAAAPPCDLVIRKQ